MPDSDFTRLRIVGLGKDVTSVDLSSHIRKLVQDVKLTDCRVIMHEGRSREFAYVGTCSSAEARRIIEKVNGTFFNTRKLTVEPAYAERDSNLPREWSNITKRKQVKDADVSSAKRQKVGSTVDTGRVRILNLSYEVDENSLRAHCQTVGPVSEVTIIIDRNENSKGYAFVTFVHSLDGIRALSELDNSILLGRRIKIEPAIERAEKNDSKILSAHKLSILSKKTARAKDSSTFNLLYVSAHAATTAISDHLGVSVEAILDTKNDVDSLAARAAIAETFVLTKTREWLAQLKIRPEDLQCTGNTLLGAKLSAKIPTSDRSIFLKHLGPWVIESDLQKVFARFGKVTRFSIAPTKTIGIVSYSHPSYAKKALEELLLQRFMNYPLYLERAPACVDDIEIVPGDELEDVHSTGEPVRSNTLYISNVSFETSEDKLNELFGDADGFRKATLLKSKKNSVARGHGFLSFTSVEAAEKFMKANLDTVIDEHHIVLERSKTSVKESTGQARVIPTEVVIIGTNRLTVKNLAFETNVKDLRQLFSAYANVKSVRIPKRSDGRSRGFGFVEFATVADAQRAYKQLLDVHLLGRRLVILPSADTSAGGAIDGNE